ncbi:transmembrane domain protein [Mycobacterium kansasii]|uniref:Transmembrane domain protein n=1 Tax=Mycobacterium kansasii TaxID=1768 RepID=A0A1V3XMG6_MYCKA|nr:transmembrane domain protein [Mycobacterium kansasii]
MDPTDQRHCRRAAGHPRRLVRSMVVAVDNAVRTSSNELAVAIDEFAKSVPRRSPGRGQRQSGSGPGVQRGPTA